MKRPTYSLQDEGELPSEEVLIDLIREISISAWGSVIEKKDIERWLDNFNGQSLDSVETERRIALWLLCNFTFYTEMEVKELCKVVYNDLIHLIVSKHVKEGTQLSVEICSFLEKTNIISAEETSGSGGYIAYLFRQINDLPLKGLFNFSINNINNGIENIVVIDDVTISSGADSQKHKFWKGAKDKYPNKRLILLTLIATQDSIDYHKNVLDVEVVSAIKLDDRHKCFSETSEIFSYFQSIKNEAEKLALYYGTKLNTDFALGYKNSQCTFGFYYNTPDNTLPIFWAEWNNWKPIFKRYHKNYSNTIFKFDGKFV